MMTMMRMNGMRGALAPAALAALMFVGMTLGGVGQVAAQSADGEPTAVPLRTGGPDFVEISGPATPAPSGDDDAAKAERAAARAAAARRSKQEAHEEVAPEPNADPMTALSDDDAPTKSKRATRREKREQAAAAAATAASAVVPDAQSGPKDVVPPAVAQKPAAVGSKAASKERREKAAVASAKRATERAADRAAEAVNPDQPRVESRKKVVALADDGGIAPVVSARKLRARKTRVSLDDPPMLQPLPLDYPAGSSASHLPPPAPRPMAAAAVPAGEGSQIPDPLEQVNKGVHVTNGIVKSSVVDPASKGIDYLFKEQGKAGFRSFFQNLSTPASALNLALQGRGGEAGQQVKRFAVNSTQGVLGFHDVAQERYGLAPVSRDFGQTLATYGTPTGAYMELPVMGRSTVRDTAGLAVDVLTGQVLDPNRKKDMVSGPAIVPGPEATAGYTSERDRYIYERELSAQQ